MGTSRSEDQVLVLKAFFGYEDQFYRKTMSLVVGFHNTAVLIGLHLRTPGIKETRIKGLNAIGPTTIAVVNLRAPLKHGDTI